MRSMNIAATGMQAQQTQVDTISHNLANMSTTGYKRHRTEFQDLMYQDLRRVGTNSSDTGTIVPTGVQIGLGVKVAAVSRAHEQGTMQNTSNPLDVAVQGRGFFRIELPTGEFAYTRDGQFQLSPEGEIVTKDGYIVAPNIVVPDEAISISVSKEGQVQAVLDGQIAPVDLGQFDLATFINPAGLDAIGDNMYLATEASGDEIIGLAGQEGFGSLLQGFLESSNVNPISEVTNMIVAQRAYEMNSKVISASDEMLQNLNQSA
ncbi:MAG: flagellar basal-body rod protein FlgG [Alphaproteobacteria bacterium]|nr:flagellar basal-body rod protein FlgG [Alphaproteobacteria bacterium]